MAQPAREVLRFPAAGDHWTRAADRLRVEGMPRTVVLYTGVWKRYKQFLAGRPPDEDTANEYLARRSYELKPRSLGVEITEGYGLSESTAPAERAHRRRADPLA